MTTVNPAENNSPFESVAQAISAASSEEGRDDWVLATHSALSIARREAFGEERGPDDEEDRRFALEVSVSALRHAMPKDRRARFALEAFGVLRSYDNLPANGSALTRDQMLMMGSASMIREIIEKRFEPEILEDLEINLAKIQSP